MRQNFTMPKLGLTMTEGLVAEWSVAPGERFTKGQTVYTVETEKAANEITAEADGVLLEVVHPVGATVPVGEVLGHWDSGEEGAPTSAERVRSDADAPAASATIPPRPAPAPSTAVGTARIVATPLARRIAEREGVDLSALSGSGPRGRIKAVDVETAARALPVASPAAVADVLPGATPQTMAASPVQLAMARRLTAAKQEIPHFYLAREVDARALLDLRAQLNAGGTRRFTLNHFIIAALGRALLDEPKANRVWADDALLSFDTPDVGVAVSSERGLYVPVLRNAGRLPMGELARQAQALVERARNGRLSAAEMSGGAVTVSNAGMFDVTYMTPIINPGQAMILGVGSVREVFRPDAEQRPSLHREIGLVLACDHRVLDGVAGLRFLGRVVGYLQNPVDLLVGA